MAAGAAADAPGPLRRALAAAWAGGARSGLFVAAPLGVAAVAYDPRAPAAAPKTAALCACALVGLGLALARPGRTARARPGAPAWLWLAFAGWMALSLAWSAHGQLGHLLPWLAVAGLALGVGRLGDVRPAARLCALLASGICASACLVGFAAGARGLALHGLCGNPDWLGLLLACALPLDVELAAEATSRWRARGPHRGAHAFSLALGWLVVAMALAALLLASARTSWVALALASLVALRGRARLVLGLAALAGAVAASALTDVGPALAGRLWIWRAGATALFAAAPLGAGLGEFPWAFLDAQGRWLAPLGVEAASGRFANATGAHQDWIEIATEGGVVGLALVVAALVLCLRQLGRSWRAGAASLGVILLSAFGDSPLSQPGVLLLLALLLAQAGIDAAAEPGATPHGSRGARVAVLAIHLGCFAAVALALRLATGSYLGARALSAARAAAPPERGAWLAAARRLDPRSGEAALEAGVDRLDAGDAQGALADFAAARARFADVATLVAIGNAHYALGDLGAACHAYEEALAWNRGSFRAHANLAEARRAAGDLDAARLHLDAARSLQPFHPKVVTLAERLRRDRIDADTRAPDE